MGIVEQQLKQQLNQSFYQRLASDLCRNYQHYTGQPLLPDELACSGDQVLDLFTAPFAILAHGVEEDPIFNFANQYTLDLFEMNWEAFTQLPSRYSAQAISQEERNKLLSAVTTHGYIDDYSGVRISATGKRFYIEQAVVWNLYDEATKYRGQAAMFKHWRAIE